jgi:hypothetical protein
MTGLSLPVLRSADGGLRIVDLTVLGLKAPLRGAFLFGQMGQLPLAELRQGI